MTVQGPIWRTVTGMQSPSALKMWVMPTLRPRRPVAMFDLALVRPATTGRGGLAENGWRARTCSGGTGPCQAALALPAGGLRGRQLQHPDTVLGADRPAEQHAGPARDGHRQRSAAGVARIASPGVGEVFLGGRSSLHAETGH